MTLRSINKRLAPHHVRLARGNGYFYFIYDHKDLFDTLSVYVASLSELPEDEWVEDGIAFAKSVEGVLTMGKIFPRTYWVFRKRTAKYKRVHAFCQFRAEFRDVFVQWLHNHLDSLYAKYGKDAISVEVEMSDGSRSPFKI